MNNKDLFAAARFTRSTLIDDLERDNDQDRWNHEVLSEQHWACQLDQDLELDYADRERAGQEERR